MTNTRAGIVVGGGGPGKEVESSCEDLWTIYGVTLDPRAVGSH